MIRTLIVDDDIQMLDWLEQVIPWAEYGFEIVGRAKNGLEAEQFCMQSMPDLLITDITMPSKDGIELIDDIKEIEQNIKSIVLTCHADFNLAQQALKLGADDYVVKDTLTVTGMGDVLKK